MIWLACPTTAGRSSVLPKACGSSRKTQTRLRRWTRSSKKPGPSPTRKSRPPAFARRRIEGQGLQKSGLFRLGRGNSAELLYQLVQLRGIVIHVFVAVIGIKVAREFGGFVGGDFLGRGFDVVTDLFARFVISTAGQGELVRRGAIAAAGADLGAVFIERILKRIGLHQHVDGPFTVADFLFEVFAQRGNRVRLSFHE